MASITQRLVNQVILRSEHHRIAVITGSLNAGGATTFLCNFAGELERRKISVMIYSFESKNSHSEDFARLGVTVWTSDQGREIYEDRLTAIYQEIARYRPTVVIANLGATSFEVLRYVPSKILRIGVTHADETRLYTMLSHYPSHLSSMAVVSATIKEKLLAMSAFSKTPVHYLPLGVPMPEDTEVSQRDFTGPLRILYLGRLEQEQKRVHLFPAMLDQLKSSGIPFHWTIAGDGPERLSLMKNMKCEAKHQTVTFTGHLHYADVPAVLAAHDIFFLVSDYEGLPLSLLEAMGWGIIPVVSDLPSGIREVVDDSTGYKVAPENTRGYMETIISIHNRRDDLKKRSHSAREKVRSVYSISAMTDRWLNIMQTEKSAVQWPETINIRPILCATNRWYFSSPVRWLRRILNNLRKAAC